MKLVVPRRRIIHINRSRVSRAFKTVVRSVMVRIDKLEFIHLVPEYVGKPKK
jgi:hypothetical protein